MLAQLMRRKAVGDATSDAEAPEHRLKRTLTALDLTALGIGAVIGAGIFSSTGSAGPGGGVRLGAGPAPGGADGVPPRPRRRPAPRLAPEGSAVPLPRRGFNNAYR